MKSAVLDPFSTPARRRRIIAGVAKSTLRSYCIKACKNVHRMRIEAAAALVLQCCIRSFQARKLTAHLRFVKRSSAAIRIQTIWRQILAIKLRKALWNKRQRRREKRLARHVEMLWYARKVRMFEAARALMKQQAKQKRLNLAAIQIQRIMRGYLARVRYSILLKEKGVKQQRRYTAALTLQCSFRQHQARHRIAALRQRKLAVILINRRMKYWWQAVCRHKSRVAKVIQRIARGFLGRVRATRRKWMKVLHSAASKPNETTTKTMTIHVDLDAQLMSKMVDGGPTFVINWSLDNSILHYRADRGFKPGAIMRQVVLSVDKALHPKQQHHLHHHHHSHQQQHQLGINEPPLLPPPPVSDSFIHNEDTHIAINNSKSPTNAQPEPVLTLPASPVGSRDIFNNYGDVVTDKTDSWTAAAVADEGTSTVTPSAEFTLLQDSNEGGEMVISLPKWDEGTPSEAPAPGTIAASWGTIWESFDSTNHIDSSGSNSSSSARKNGSQDSNNDTPGSSTALTTKLIEEGIELALASSYTAVTPDTTGTTVSGHSSDVPATSLPTASSTNSGTTGVRSYSLLDVLNARKSIIDAAKERFAVGTDQRSGFKINSSSSSSSSGSSSSSSSRSNSSSRTKSGKSKPQSRMDRQQRMSSLVQQEFEQYLEFKRQLDALPVPHMYCTIIEVVLKAVSNDVADKGTGSDYDGDGDGSTFSTAAAKGMSSIDDLKFRFKNALVFVTAAEEEKQELSDVAEADEDDEEKEAEADDNICIEEVHSPPVAALPDIIEEEIAPRPRTAVVKIVFDDSPLPTPEPSPPPTPPTPVDFQKHATIIQRATRSRLHYVVTKVIQIQQFYRRRNLLLMWQHLGNKILDIAHYAAVVLQSSIRKFIAHRRVLRLKYLRDFDRYKFGHDFSADEVNNWKAFGSQIPPPNPYSDALLNYPVISASIPDIIHFSGAQHNISQPTQGKHEQQQQEVSEKLSSKRKSGSKARRILSESTKSDKGGGGASNAVSAVSEKVKVITSNFHCSSVELLELTQFPAPPPGCVVPHSDSILAIWNAPNMEKQQQQQQQVGKAQVGVLNCGDSNTAGREDLMHASSRVDSSNGRYHHHTAVDIAASAGIRYQVVRGTIDPYIADALYDAEVAAIEQAYAAEAVEKQRLEQLQQERAVRRERGRESREIQNMMLEDTSDFHLAAMYMQREHTDMTAEDVNIAVATAGAFAVAVDVAVNEGSVELTGDIMTERKTQSSKPLATSAGNATSTAITTATTTATTISNTASTAAAVATAAVAASKAAGGNVSSTGQCFDPIPRLRYDAHAQYRREHLGDIFVPHVKSDSENTNACNIPTAANIAIRSKPGNSADDGLYVSLLCAASVPIVSDTLCGDVQLQQQQQQQQGKEQQGKQAPLVFGNIAADLAKLPREELIYRDHGSCNDDSGVTSLALPGLAVDTNTPPVYALLANKFL